MARERSRTSDWPASYKLMPLGIPHLLSLLTDVRAFENYLNRALKIPKDDQLSLGYSFLIASILERLIDALLLDPSLFGVKMNKLVERSFQKDVPFSEFPDRSSIGKMIRNLAYLYRELLPVRTLSDLSANVRPIRKYLLPELTQWSKDFEFSNRDGAEIPIGQIQRDLSSIFLLYSIHETKYVNVALNHTFHRGKRYDPQYHDLPVYIRSQRFFEGFKFGLSYLWHSLLGEEAARLRFMTKLLRAKDWDEYYLVYPVVKNEIVEQAEHRVDDLRYAVAGNEPTLQWLKCAKPIGIYRRNGIMDRLDEKFAKHEVRIVSEKYTPKVASGLIISLLGSMEFYPDKTRLVRFVHPESDGRNRYSYAMFVSVPIVAGDESEWWLFFDFCDDYSPRGLTAFRPIESFIQYRKSRLEVSTFQIKAGKLLQYVHTYPDFSKSIMNPMIREFNNLGTLSGLRLLLVSNRIEKYFARGLVLELVVHALVTRLGYNSKWRFKRAILGKELDILAFKEEESGESEFLVVECSTEYSPNLLNEIESKLRLVESKSDDLVKVFAGKSHGHLRVSGWLVTTARIDLENTRIPPNIMILDWPRLSKLCRMKGINTPSGLEELLTKQEFPPPFVLNPSSILFGTTPPPTEEAEGEATPRKQVTILADGFLLPEKWFKLLQQKSTGNSKIRNR